MIKKLRNIIATLLVSSSMLLPVLVPVTVHADSSSSNTISGLCGGASLTVQNGQCNPSSTDSLNNIIKWILNIFTIVVGITAVIMILVGGFKYVVSGGDSTRVSGAKDTILFAIVGLVVVALAQIIVHFVLTNVGNQI